MSASLLREESPRGRIYPPSAVEHGQEQAQDSTTRPSLDSRDARATTTAAMPDHAVAPRRGDEHHRSSTEEDATLTGDADVDEDRKDHAYDHDHDDRDVLDAPFSQRRPSHAQSQHDLDHDQADPRLRLRVFPSYLDGSDHLDKPRTQSPSVTKEEGTRATDEREMARIEHSVSREERAGGLDPELISGGPGRNRSVLQRSRSRTVIEEPDVFDTGTTPLHEKNKIYQPPPHPATKVARFIKHVHQSSWLVRYFVYITPLTIIILIPLLLGRLLFKEATVGGVRLFWFSIFLMIIWLSLWAARLIAKCLPFPMGLISSIFTNNSKKWRDLGKALEIPATLFFWLLAIEIAFLPTMVNHHLNGNKSVKHWERTTNRVIVSIFVGMILNFVAKILIQLIAISFHLRTYADRIEINKFQISSLVKLYEHSRQKIAAEDSEFEEKQPVSGPDSGARTPMVYVEKAQRVAQKGLSAVGDVAGKVAGDFTGKVVASSSHPHQVVLQLLSTNTRSQILARRLWRTYRHPDEENVSVDDLKSAFSDADEAEAAFQMFDKDMNGDISMEELEAVCVEIGRERKAITASLKDLDSVVSKLDDFFLFVVFVVTILVFISLISTSAAGVLTSAGSAVLALSWLFSATAQEFLQSCIFVFVKHPFDVGDRVTIYGNTGTLLKGDDYYVKEISLLYTEFKKLQGHVVQAPNSYLNTLFVLNQRRSGALAEAVPVTLKWGTTIEQIDALRERLLEFVSNENREYQSNIITELTTLTEARSIEFNVVFFFKSNWQNELLRLQRRNKFICAMMVTMQELGMEGPHRVLPGGNSEFPVYLSGAYPPQAAPAYSEQPTSPTLGPGPRSGSLARESSVAGSVQPFPSIGDFPVPQTGPQPQQHPARHPSILRSRGDSAARRRGESLSTMGRRVDFSLGMSAVAASGADFGDVFDDPRPRIPTLTTTVPSPQHSGRESRVDDDSDGLARTTSRDSGSALGKVNSAGSNGGGSRVTHRNRFFGRGRSKLGLDDGGANADDVEAGRRTLHVDDMPHIPEASGARAVSPGMIREEEEEEEDVDVDGANDDKGQTRKDTQGPNKNVSFTRRSTLATEKPSTTMRSSDAPRGRFVSRFDGAADTSARSSVQPGHGIDPRTGVVSPVAVANDEDRDQGGVLSTLVGSHAPVDMNNVTPRVRRAQTRF